MLVCVPVGANGVVDPRWGRAARVAVADLRHGAILTWHEFDVGWDRLHDEGTEGGHHARVASFLREHQVDTVVAHHMGDPMIQMMERMGIAVHLGASGSAREAAVAGAKASSA